MKRLTLLFSIGLNCFVARSVQAQLSSDPTLLPIKANIIEQSNAQVSEPPIGNEGQKTVLQHSDLGRASDLEVTQSTDFRQIINELTGEQVADGTVPDSINLPNQEPLSPDLPNAPPDLTEPPASKIPPQTPPVLPNPNYKLPPQIAQPERVAPFLTLFPLNDVPVTHLTKWQVGIGSEFGNQTDLNILGDGLYTLKSEVKQSLSIDNLFTSEQEGYYLQAKTIQVERIVSTESSEPVSLNGLQIQQTFTGSCALVGTIVTTDQQCSFTPALVTDRNSLDPDLLVPTRILTLGQVGDIVSNETLAILSQPGFQNIGANGEGVGLDLFFPNVGSIPGNIFSTQTEVNRKIDLDYRPTLGFHRVHQIYKANDQKAKLGRTIYGFTGIWMERNLEVNLPVQAVVQIFPKINPTLKGNPKKDAVFSINRNLISAANNARLPENSFVAYHGGISAAKHRLSEQKKSPSAFFNGVWFGLSPVKERTLATEVRFDPTGPTEIIASGGGEGGANTDISFSSIINQNGLITNLDTANLTDFYTQIYLAFLQTPANFINRRTVTETVTYHPHVSLTGTFTDQTQLARYYSGVIAKVDPIAYLGADYSKEIIKDLRLNIGAIGYINPDREYYSRANGRLAKTFRFGRRRNLTVSTNFLYVFDRPQDDLDVILNDPIDNYVTVGLKGQVGPMTAGVTQFFDILPDSTPTSTGADVNFELGRYGSIGGYILPQNSIMNYGIQAQLRLRRSPNTPTISFVWNRAMFDFGVDNGGNQVNSTEDKFVVFLRFGRPDDPFRPRAIATQTSRR